MNTVIRKSIQLLLLSFIGLPGNINAQQKMKTATTLSKAEQSIIAISALTAKGDLEKLKPALHNGLDNGLTINEIKEELTHLYAYCGFPRSLNGISTFKTVLDERKAKGITDSIGKEIIVENNVADKYEQGRKVLEELTKTPQAKPAPGYGEFVPRIDAFLKEHLFADVFASDVLNYQQREWITISALASMPGVEPQLKSHIGIGLNTGITTEQLKEFVSIIQSAVGKEAANSVQNGLNEVLKNYQSK